LGAITFTPTSPRGFTGDGRFVAEFRLSGKLLGSGAMAVRTLPNCRRARAAAGLL